MSTQEPTGSMREAKPRYDARRAHTLPEVLLVLTILAIFAAIAFPRFAAAMFRTHMDGAFQAIRADITYTRARAIATGLRHQLTIDSSTRELLVQPYHPEESTAGSPTAGNAATAVDVTLRDTIPEDVKVVEWTVSPLGVNDPSVTSSMRPGTLTGQPLTFYPEGSGDSAELILEDSQGSRRGLQVDGNTGEIHEMTADELRQR